MTDWLVVYARKDGLIQREVIKAESIRAVVVALTAENEMPLAQITIEPLNPEGRVFTF